MKTIVGLDVETAKIPNHFPWFQKYYLSTVSLSFPDDTVKTWVFIHSQHIIDTKLYARQINEVELELNKYDMVAAHNLKFDMNQLRSLKFPQLHCTMVAEYLLNYQQKGGLKLDDLSPKYGLPLKVDKIKIMWDSGIDTDKIPLSLLCEYCESDAWKARKIAEAQQKQIKNTGMSKLFDLQMRWLDMLSTMESHGIKWNNNTARTIVHNYTRYRAILEVKIHKMLQLNNIGPGLNISLTSGDELSCIIYGGKLKRKEKRSVIREKNVKTRMPFLFTYKDGTTKIKQRWNNHPNTKIIRRVYQDIWYDIKGLGIKPIPKSELSKSTPDKPYYKTDKDTLPFLQTTTLTQKRILKLLNKLSSVNKVITTFINPEKGTGLINKLGIDGYLHTNYNQTVTATGRLSSSNPNSQNLPRGNTSPVKKCIIPRFDWILNADLSQIEWRVPAFLSQDQVMINEINSGVDQHSATCTKLMGFILNKLNRFYAKTFNFRMIYGGTAWGFFKDPTMPKFSIKKWKQIVIDFFLKYFDLKKWQDKNISHVINGNGTLTLPTGRKFKFFVQPWNGKYSENQIKNYPVQGMAGGDILPLAAIIIWDAMKKLRLKSIPILTVHDSLVFDVVDDEVDIIADLCIKVFKNLPKYIQHYWGIKWNVNLTGEVEKGKTYGNLKRIR